MAWHAQRSRERIQRFMSDVPQVVAENYSDVYLPKFLAEQEQRRHRGLSSFKPLVALPKDRAVLVDTVQVYVNLINYDQYRLDEGLETERSHARALNFLHLHYGACDRIIAESLAQRVDFHGPRVHAVVIDPTGRMPMRERVTTAVDLANRMMLLSRLANAELAHGNYEAKYRVGIDVGPCVAINSGQSDEQEPLFLGSAANYAAKLAEGSEPGIYLSDRARAALALPQLGTLDRRTVLSEASLAQLTGTAQASAAASRVVAEWRDDIREHRAATGGQSSFVFHYHKPPLETIDYSKLSPGNSIRMPLMSMFADLDGYTAYIDQAAANRAVADAVRALHVIRSELQSTLEDDFGGRKVRFIGDCMHGMLAVGTSTAVNAASSIRSAVRCAGGLRSSFDLCKQMLPGIAGLGLAIGMEYGSTPISRIGIRGDRSVRIASSVATAQSEAVQQRCNGQETALGMAAFNTAPTDVQRLFGPARTASNLSYDDADMMVVREAPQIIAGSSDFRAHSE